MRNNIEIYMYKLLRSNEELNYFYFDKFVKIKLK